MNKALIIGISDYPVSIGKLPAVAADVREVGKILGSKNGLFSGSSVEVITDQAASNRNVLRSIEHTFRSAASEDTILVYIAGHGTVSTSNDAYYFVAHDTVPSNLPDTAVALATIKTLLDQCKSQRAFLWLDFCHSGGIIPRRMQIPSENLEAQVFARTLKVMSGQGKMIYAACTSTQVAYENSNGHGIFTGHLLEGLRGAATVSGEITANSLFDFIARKMPTADQQPMQFGHMTGLVVFLHVPDISPKTLPAKSKAVASTGKATNRSSAVSDSGDWCQLGQHFFKAQSVRRANSGVITLEIVSTDSESDSLLSRFRPSAYGNSGPPITFAHRNDAEFVEIKEVGSVSEKSKQVWTLELKPQQVHQGLGGMEMTFQTGGKSHSPADLARMRAGRILLNDPPPSEARQDPFGSGGIGEAHIRGFDVPIPATECTVRKIFAGRGVKDKTTIQLARLAAIVALKGGNVCEQILELSLGPIAQGFCHVKFRGVRQRNFVNVEPAIVELEGDCSLE